jgi:hypothetical protein
MHDVCCMLHILYSWGKGKLFSKKKSTYLNELSSATSYITQDMGKESSRHGRVLLQPRATY